MKLKRIICLLVIVVLSAAALVSCSQENYVPAGFQKVSGKAVDYNFYVPDSWIVDISTGVVTSYVSAKDRSNVSMMAFEIDSSLIYAEIKPGTTTVGDNADPAPTAPASSESAPVGSDSGTGTETSTDTEETKIVTIDDYWKYYSKVFTETFADMEYSVNGEKMVVASHAAQKYVYTATVTGQQYKFMQVVFMAKGRVYIFTYTALPDMYDKHIEQVDQIIDYISFS